MSLKVKTGHLLRLSPPTHNSETHLWIRELNWIFVRKKLLQSLKTLSSRVVRNSSAYLTVCKWLGVYYKLKFCLSEIYTFILSLCYLFSTTFIWCITICASVSGIFALGANFYAAKAFDFKQQQTLFCDTCKVSCMTTQVCCVIIVQIFCTGMLHIFELLHC